MNKPTEYIADSPVWVDKVRQISPSDRVLGGTGEPANWQAKDLSDRTAYLKAQQDSAAKSISKINDDLSEQGKNIKDVDVKVKPITEGGTGATTAADARKNLGLGTSATLNKTDAFGTSENLVATQLLVDKLQKEMFDAMPVGVIVSWDHAVAPKNWLFVRDQKFSATEYPELAKLYPSLTLNDRRGTVDRGLDAGRGFDSGRVLGSYQEDALEDHVHRSEADGSYYALNALKEGDLALAKKKGVTGGILNGRIANETRMKNVATNKIIKAK